MYITGADENMIERCIQNAFLLSCVLVPGVYFGIFIYLLNCSFKKSQRKQIRGQVSRNKKMDDTDILDFLD